MRQAVGRGGDSGGLWEAQRTRADGHPRLYPSPSPLPCENSRNVMSQSPASIRHPLLAASPCAMRPSLLLATSRVASRNIGRRWWREQRQARERLINAAAGSIGRENGWHNVCRLSLSYAHHASRAFQPLAFRHFRHSSIRSSPWPASRRACQYPQWSAF